jgi:hypothetical protein
LKFIKQAPQLALDPSHSLRMTGLNRHFAPFAFFAVKALILALQTLWAKARQICTRAFKPPGPQRLELFEQLEQLEQLELYF